MPYNYPSRRAKRVDFWSGYLGWFIANAALVLLTTVLDPSIRAGAAALLVFANIGALIVAAILRQYIALGLALAFASLFALTVVEGVFFTVSDFAGGLYNTPVTIGFLIAGGVLYLIGAFFVLRAVHRGIR